MELAQYNELLSAVCKVSFEEKTEGKYLVARKVDDRIEIYGCDALESAVKRHDSFSEDDRQFHIFPPKIPHPLFRRL